MQKRMNLKKWNKEKLLLRILTFPLKLLFQLLWANLSSILLCFKWLKNGSQELVYGDDHKSSLVEILESNQKIIESFKL